MINAYELLTRSWEYMTNYEILIFSLNIKCTGQVLRLQVVRSLLGFLKNNKVSILFISQTSSPVYKSRSKKKKENQN